MAVYKKLKDRLEVDLNPAELPPVILFGVSKQAKASPPLDMHSHGNVLEIIYVEKGSIIYETDGGPFQLNGGNIFLNFPNEIHGSGHFPQERTIHYWLGISMDKSMRRNFGRLTPEMDRLLKSLLDIPNRQFRGDPRLGKLFEKFVATMTSEQPCRNIISTGLFIEIISVVLECATHHENSYPTLPIRRCLQFINKNMYEKIQIEQLAEVAHLSVPRIKQRFRTEIGVPPYDYILRQKIEKSKDLLQKKDRTITDIALLLGFSSSQHFATLFKKMSSQTPTEFIQTVTE